MERVAPKHMKEKILNVMKKVPKSRYSIVEVLGDFYYKEMPID